MVKELKDFLLRGNVVELAVAVVIAGAFGLIVASFVEQLINPLIGLIFGQPDLSAIVIETTSRSGEPVIFGIGAFLNTVINFAIVGTVLFLVIRAANNMMERRKAVEEEVVVVDETPEDVVLLREIRDSLRTRA